MLVLTCRRAFDGSGGVDVADDGVGLLVGVSEFEEPPGTVLLTILIMPRRPVLVLNEREIGLDAVCRNPS